VILRPRRLAVALAAGELSEREKFEYLLVWAVIGILVPSHMGGWTDWSRIRVAFLVISLVITVIGLLTCFGTNARGDNRAFLERYLCLSVPLGVMTYVAYYAIYYAMAVVGLLVGWVDTNAANWDANTMGLISSMSALILYFVWLRASILRAAGLQVT
jgi:hypothetical protein